MPDTEDELEPLEKKLRELLEVCRFIPDPIQVSEDNPSVSMQDLIGNKTACFCKSHRKMVDLLNIYLNALSGHNQTIKSFNKKLKEHGRILEYLNAEREKYTTDPSYFGIIQIEVGYSCPSDYIAQVTATSRKGNEYYIPLRTRDPKVAEPSFWKRMWANPYDLYGCFAKGNIPKGDYNVEIQVQEYKSSQLVTIIPKQEVRVDFRLPEGMLK